MQDPFQTLGLPPRFDLDLAELHTRYIRASALTHPDRFTDPVDQAQAAERAAQINQAYAVLNDPERRADTLLILRAGPTREQDKSLPPDLLMDMMEIRERMEQALDGNDRTELDKLHTWAQQQRDTHLKKIAEQFGQCEDALSPDAGQAIRLELNALRYIQRMIEQLPV